MNSQNPVLTQISTYGATEQDAVVNAFLNAFYTSENGAGNFVLDSVTKKYPGELDFWRMAEELEVAEDIYDRSKEAKHKAIVEELFKGFLKVNGTDWSANIYNDDLAWITIAAARAYKITGESSYLETAVSTFAYIWVRAYDPSDDGLWWTTDNTSKNACIAGPAAVAALLLHQCTGDDEYLDMAKTIFNWEVKTLYDASGMVHDHVTAEGVVSGGATTYNQGTFVGAAHLLNLATGTTDYEEYALTTARYTRDNCIAPGGAKILRGEYEKGDGNNDCAGFKGIFTRWCGLWARDTGNTEILDWMRTNVDAVLTNRNSFGLTWGHWADTTPETALSPWECSSAVALLQNVPPA
jgi:predicted alpha-1,6-mannanase (GH76 family)